MDSGMEFQMTGPATEKALSPNLVLVLGLMQLLLPEERSCQCVEVLLTGVSTSLICLLTYLNKALQYVVQLTRQCRGTELTR